MTTVYQHPDGHSIDFTDNTLTVVSCDGAAVSVPMGLQGLAALGKNLETELTEGDCAEQAGNLLATNVLSDFQECDSQSEKLVLLMESLQSLATLQHHDRAAAGFAVGLLNVLEVGLQHLPKGGQ
jgi:hypothetical protein